MVFLCSCFVCSAYPHTNFMVDWAPTVKQRCLTCPQVPASLSALAFVHIFYCLLHADWHPAAICVHSYWHPSLMPWLSTVPVYRDRRAVDSWPLVHATHWNTGCWACNHGSSFSDPGSSPTNRACPQVCCLQQCTHSHSRLPNQCRQFWRPHTGMALHTVQVSCEL